MYVAVGLGVLTKGPVAIALPALAFALYLAVRGELRRITEMMIPLGIVIVAVDRRALVLRRSIASTGGPTSSRS